MTMKSGAPLSPYDVISPSPPIIENLLPYPLLFPLLSLSLFIMPTNTKKDPRDKVGEIVHAVANRALSDHTAKNIFGNVNYAKHFLQGTVMGFFDGRPPGGKNAVWKLTVNFEMPSDGTEVELKRVDIVGRSLPCVVLVPRP